jgi:penicillin-binding protein 1A
LVTNPKTGNIKAWVGGISFKNFQYDHVLAQRQVGSVFKPIVYSKALIDGKSPCDFIPNRKTIYSEYNDWSPKNSNGKYEGKYSLVGALTNSINTVSVHLCMQSGIKNVIAYAEELGITDSLPEVPSIALGVSNISLKNMIAAYGTFANNENYIKPNTITAIYNKEKQLIFELKIESHSIIEQEIAQDITNMLRSVVDNGTAKRLR